MDKDKLFADARKKALDAIASQISELDPQKFAGELVKMLNARKNDVIWQLLGLDNRWGKWEIDRCNGRESKITQYLAAETEPYIRDWINQAVKDVLGKGFTKEISKSFEEEIRERYSYKLRTTLMQQAEELGIKHANEMIEQLKLELTQENECEPA